MYSPQYRPAMIQPSGLPRAAAEYPSQQLDMSSSSLGSTSSSPVSDTYQGESETNASDGSAPPHNWIQVGNVTTTRVLSHLVLEDTSAGNGVRTFFCGWQGCTHPVGFPHKSQLVTHIRSVHLQEKPFLCTTCKTPFARKQDAVRHVTTANSGTRYPCNVCSKTFARKSYRDSHQDICDLRTMVISRARSQPQVNYPQSHPYSSAPRYLPRS
jgi:hypothetical protein